MSTPLANKRRVRNISEFIQSITQLIFSAGPLVMAFAMQVMEMYGQYIFVFTWVLDVIKSISNSLALMWSPNKNIQRAGSLTVNWIDLSISTLMIFGAAFIGAAAFFPLIATMLVFTPAVYFIKTCWYAINLLRTKNAAAREKYYEEVKSNVLGGVVSGLLSAAIIAIFFIPGMPVAATIAISVALSIIIIPVAVYAIVSEIIKLKSWITYKINKRYEKNKALVEHELSTKPVLRMLADLPQQQENEDKNEVSEKELPLIERVFTDYSNLNENIERHRVILQTQVTNSEGLFQEGKRLNKIQSLGMLKGILAQWINLFIQDKKINDREYHASINLSNNFIIDNIAHLHNNPNSARDREKVIKRIKQHVYKTWPDAFQSFFKDKGQVEMLFEQAFDYMRSMKTEHEIEREKNVIRAEITAYNKNYNKFWGKLATESKCMRHETIIANLGNMLDNDDETNLFKDGQQLKRVFAENKQCYKMYEKIRSLQKSETMLHELKQGMHSESDEPTVDNRI